MSLQGQIKLCMMKYYKNICIVQFYDWCYDYLHFKTIGTSVILESTPVNTRKQISKMDAVH